MNQAGVQEQAAVKVQSMALNNQKAQAAELEKLLNGVQAISDPAKGQKINLLA